MNSRVRDAYAARAAEYTAVLGSISATAYYWPLAETTDALAAAGFAVEETHTRTDPGSRPHAAVVARRTSTTPTTE